jgi:hypothetical protein
MDVFNAQITGKYNKTTQDLSPKTAKLKGMTSQLNQSKLGKNLFSLVVFTFYYVKMNILSTFYEK